jgi:hypothetical protein
MGFGVGEQFSHPLFLRGVTMTVSLTQLTTRSKQLADMVNSSFISSTEWTDYINAGYAELYDLVVASFEDYFTTTTTLTITTGNTASLPAAFYKLRALDYSLNGTYVNCTQFNFSERNSLSSSTSALMANRAGRQYRIVSDTIYIIPEDRAAGSYQLWYVPAITPLSAGGDLLPTSLSKFGWEEYICIYAAERALNKQESDISVLAAMRVSIAGRIVSMAANRNVDQPERITDLQTDSFNSVFTRDYDGA